jgi:DNA recombination protein RmuC
MTPTSLAILLLLALLIGLALGAALGWALRGREVDRHGPEATQAALEPVNQALIALNRMLTGVARDEAAARSALSEQVRELHDSSARTAAGLQRETRRLVGALSRSDVRGRWGEMQLRRLLETSGLRPGVHYEEQPVVHTDDGIRRPDALIHLGQGQTVVIDAKVSLAAFLQAEAADPGPEQEAALTAHAAEIRAHVGRLGAKGYWREFDSAPDFVVMFLPAEALLAEALARDPGLLETAFDHDVILATPTTLQALLRTVAHVRRHEVLAENARVVAELGRELHDRLLTLVGHFDRIGASLTGAVQAYNRAVGSFDTRVLVSARRFATLAGQDAAITAPREAEATVRTVIGEGRPLGTQWSDDGEEVASLAFRLDPGASIATREPAPARNR